MGREDFALAWLRFLVAFCACSHKCYYVMVLLLAGVYCHRNSWGFWSSAACSGEWWSEQWEEKLLRGGCNLFNFLHGRTKLKTSRSLPEYLSSVSCSACLSLLLGCAIDISHQLATCILRQNREGIAALLLIITIFILFFVGAFFSFPFWTEVEMI